jgi:hypothetical protein
MKKELWVIDGVFVMEPFLGGQVLGELGNGFEIPSDATVIALTQEEFDQMVEDFNHEHGHYPDQ